MEPAATDCRPETRRLIEVASKSITSPTYQDLIHPVPTWYLEPDRTAPARARHYVADQLKAWRLDPLKDDALVIVSELVTNAVRVGKKIHLALHAVLAAGNTLLRIEVIDRGHGPSEIRTPALPEPDAEHGRGLPIVDALTHSWGRDSYAHRTLVWAQLLIPAPTAAWAYLVL